MNCRSLNITFRFLAALLVTLASVVVISINREVLGTGEWIALLSFVPIFGAVTITYFYPSTGAGNAGVPTAAQMLNFNMLTGTIVGLAADTQGIITHNMALPAGDISNLFPTVILEPQADPTTGAWFVVSENPNFTVMQKNQLGAGPTTKFTIARPHTITR